MDTFLYSVFIHVGCCCVDQSVWEDWIHDHFPGIHLMTVIDTDALRDAIGLGAALSFVSDYVANMGYHNKEQKIVPLDMEDKTITYFLSLIS